MAIRKILGKEEEVLHKVAHPITAFDHKLHALLDDMKETLEDADGAGLAAPQVGILRRAVIVMDDNWEAQELINPEIIERDGEQYGTEGCLSVPGLYGYVTRPMRVKVRAQDRTGKSFVLEGTGLTARAFCHEIDHLEGRIFTELADKLLTAQELDRILQEQEEQEGQENSGSTRRRRRR